MGQHVESTQVVPLSKQNNQEVTTNKDTHAWIRVLTVSNKSAKLGQTCDWVSLQSGYIHSWYPNKSSN